MRGQGGLGPDGQREAVRGHLDAGGWTLLGEFIDVESGKAVNHSQPRFATELARPAGATVPTSKLDRLSRGCSLPAWLAEGSVGLVAVDMPNANNFMIGIMAPVQQQEWEASAAGMARHCLAST